jgi:pyrroloquinoline quinone (PQQ) biosynthesis protein C
MTMAWLRRHYEASLAELDATAERLRDMLRQMDDDPQIDNEAYDAVQDFLDAQLAARRTLEDRWVTRHYTSADWQQARLIARNMD